MITAVELNESGAMKFSRWFATVAKPAVSDVAIAIDVCDIMMDRLSSGESLVYELRGLHTMSGRPELLRLERADLEIQDDDDGEG